MVWPTDTLSYGLNGAHKTGNLCSSTLTAAITGTPATFTVASASTNTVWPTENFVVRIKKTDGTQNEFIFVSSRSGLTLTVGSRGIGGTSPVDHDNGSDVIVVDLSELLQNIIASVKGHQENPGVAATQVATKTTTYTATVSDCVLRGDATGGAFTITLPTAVGATGRFYFFLKIDSTANAITIDGAGAETIDGSATATLTNQYDSILIYSNGTNWESLASTPMGTIDFENVTGTSKAMVPNFAYLANNASLVTFTLPATAPVGSRLRVYGHGAGLWKIAQNAGQVIHFNSIDTTTGTGGSLQATHRRNSIELVCVVASTEFLVAGSTGNITWV